MARAYLKRYHLAAYFQLKTSSQLNFSNLLIHDKWRRRRPLFRRWYISLRRYDWSNFATFINIQKVDNHIKGLLQLGQL